MPSQLEILHHVMHICNAHSARIVSNAGNWITVEVVIGRKQMEPCATAMIAEGWEGNVVSIEKILPTDQGYSETSEGLYRYTLQVQKF